MYAGCVEKKKRKTLGQTQNLPPPLASTTKGRTQSRSPELHTTRSLLHSPFLLFHRVQRHTHTTAHKQRRPIAAEAVIRKKKKKPRMASVFQTVPFHRHSKGRMGARRHSGKHKTTNQSIDRTPLLRPRASRNNHSDNEHNKQTVLANGESGWRVRKGER